MNTINFHPGPKLKLRNHSTPLSSSLSIFKSLKRLTDFNLIFTTFLPFCPQSSLTQVTIVTVQLVFLDLLSFLSIHSPFCSYNDCWKSNHAPIYFRLMIKIFNIACKALFYSFSCPILHCSLHGSHNEFLLFS